MLTPANCRASITVTDTCVCTDIVNQNIRRHRKISDRGSNVLFAPLFFHLLPPFLFFLSSLLLFFPLLEGLGSAAITGYKRLFTHFTAFRTHLVAGNTLVVCMQCLCFVDLSSEKMFPSIFKERGLNSSTHSPLKYSPKTAKQCLADSRRVVNVNASDISTVCNLTTFDKDPTK